MKNWLITVALLGSTFCSYGQDGFIGDGPRLAYWQVGHNTQTVIVLHGGAGAPHSYLRPEFDALSKTARVIYYDQRGCGKSDTSTTYIWQEHVADLNRLIRTLAKGQKVFLAGSSWGSLLALLYAYTYPEDVKGLILSGTVPWYGEEAVYTRDYFPATKVIRMPMREKRIITKPGTDGPTRQDTVIVSKEFDLYTGLPQQEPLSSRKSAPKAERLKLIKAPVLLFNGTYGQDFDWVGEYIKLLPDVELHTINAAGHDSWFSNPALFFSISNQFIQSKGK